MFNRRSFLLNGTSAAALVATGGLGSSRRLFGYTGSLDPTVLDNAAGAHAFAVGNSFNGNGSPLDIRRLATAQASVLSAMQASNFDVQFKAAIAGVSATSINLANVDYSSVVSRIQNYAPAFQMADLQTIQSFVPTDSDSISQALKSLQQGGLTPTVQATIPVYQKMYTDLVAQSNGGLSELRYPFSRNAHPVRASANLVAGRARDAVYEPSRDRPHLSRAVWQRATMNLPETSGSGCAADGMAGTAFGTAVAVVAFMCFVSVIGDPICLPIIAIWAGTASAGWALGHVVKCGF